MAEQKAGWAAENASSAALAAKPQAEVTALRASEEASTSYNALSDRVALKRALKRDDLATDRVEVNRSGSRRLLTLAEINAAVARAEQRSKKVIAIAHPAPVKKPTQNRIKHCRAMISGEVARDCDHAS